MVLGVKGQHSNTGYRRLPDLFESISTIRMAGPPFNRPTGVALSSSGDILVSDGYGNARVHRFDPEGRLQDSWGAPGPSPGQFRLPHSVRVDGEDRIWVVDRENSRVQVFDEDFNFVSQFTDLIRPTDLYIRDGLVYVSELCKRVSIFTVGGELLVRWGNEGEPVDDPLFVAPHSIAVDSEGSIYVGEVARTYAKVDRGLRTILKFARV
jgi:streptogramin lyase